MAFHIATKHTKRICRHCKKPIFIGCAYYDEGHGKIKCDSCDKEAKKIKLTAWETIAIFLTKPWW